MTNPPSSHSLRATNTHTEQADMGDNKRGQKGDSAFANTSFTYVLLMLGYSILFAGWWWLLDASSSDSMCARVPVFWKCRPPRSPNPLTSPPTYYSFSSGGGGAFNMSNLAQAVCPCEVVSDA
jgi:hypothetical protein